MNTKLLLIFGIVCLLSTATLLFFHRKTNKTPGVPNEISEAFAQFQKKYQKTYSDSNEAGYRLSVFVENYEKIQKNNEENSSYVLGITQFADLTTAEFQQKILMNNLSYLGEVPRAKKAQELIGAPLSVDWRKKGAVTPIKDQGNCGSCWAFSSTGVLEGSSFIQGGSLSNLSEQQLVDCCGPDGFQCQGCNGAWPKWAMDYVKAKGLSTEQEYPYTAVQGQCVKDSGDFQISDYTLVKDGDLDGLKNAVIAQPVSVCVDASQWSLYSGGVFDNCSDDPSAQDHAVLLVGYTLQYWIVKNSWNTSWGEDGYIRLKRGNTCGIALNALTTTI